ncbi:MAG: hypothetical protein NTY48_05795 [Candidatus Diapherotrites archaeon]|nr:hypothetical protein [Candidatus Diapherotrites archaeon]
MNSCELKKEAGKGSIGLKRGLIVFVLITVFLGVLFGCTQSATGGMYRTMEII